MARAVTSMDDRRYVRLANGLQYMVGHLRRASGMVVDGAGVKDYGGCGAFHTERVPQLPVGWQAYPAPTRGIKKADSLSNRCSGVSSY